MATQQTPRNPPVLDRWPALHARETTATVDRQRRDAEIRALSQICPSVSARAANFLPKPSTTDPVVTTDPTLPPDSRASLLIQLWREREARDGCIPIPATNRGKPGSTVFAAAVLSPDDNNNFSHKDPFAFPCLIQDDDISVDLTRGDEEIEDGKVVLDEHFDLIAVANNDRYDGSLMGTKMADHCDIAVLFPNPKGTLFGIVKVKDPWITTLVERMRLDQTGVSKLVTRNLVFAMEATMGMDMQHKIVPDFCVFLETLQERILKPYFLTIVTENMKVAIVSPSDRAYLNSEKMYNFIVNSVNIDMGCKLQGFITFRAEFMRVVSQNLSPELIPAEELQMSRECQLSSLVSQSSVIDTLDQKAIISSCLGQKVSEKEILDIQQSGMMSSKSGAPSALSGQNEPPSNLSAGHARNPPLPTSRRTITEIHLPLLQLLGPVGTANTGHHLHLSLSTTNLQKSLLSSHLTYKIGSSSSFVSRGSGALLKEAESESYANHNITWPSRLCKNPSSGIGLVEQTGMTGLAEVTDPVQQSKRHIPQVTTLEIDQHRSAADLTPAPEIEKTKKGFTYLQVGGILAGAVALTSFGLIVYLRRSKA